LLACWYVALVEVTVVMFLSFALRKR